MRFNRLFIPTKPREIESQVSADRRSAIMRDGVAERLATYIVRSAVHRGKRVTAESLRAYADLLDDDKSEFSSWITELQDEADDVLG